MGCLIWSHDPPNIKWKCQPLTCCLCCASSDDDCVLWNSRAAGFLSPNYHRYYYCYPSWHVHMYTWWWICWYYSIYIMCPWKSWIPIWSWRLIKMYMYIIKLYPRQNECPLGNQFVLILLLDTSHTKPKRISRHSRLGLLIRLLWFDIRAAKWAPNKFMM